MLCTQHGGSSSFRRVAMKIKANGIEMEYELTGEGDCLVLIHGYSDNLNLWYNQVPAFSQHCQILTYDVRGFGKTEVREATYSMGLFAEDLRALLEALSIKSACVLGYSMGGRIALEFALTYPEMTAGLILANSGIGETPSQEMRERRQMMVEVLQQGDIEVIADLMTEASFSPGLKDRDPTAYEKYKSIKMQNDPSEYLAVMQAIVGSIDSPVNFGSLRCPTLIIAGDQDGFMSVSLGEEMRDAIPDAEMHVLPTGHAAMIEEPEAYNRIVLEFLEGLK
jgi:pimeloyl-ACP methyl ester carboxylesterase